MSNNNAFWGKRFGYYSETVPKGHNKPRGNCFTVKSYGGTARTPSKDQQKNRNKNSPQSRRDRETYQEFKQAGKNVVMVYGPTARRIALIIV